jgi:hypothetical protein
MGLNGCREDAGRPRGEFEDTARLDVQRAVCQEKNGELGEGRGRIGRWDDGLDGEGGGEGSGEGYEGTQRGRNRDQSWLSDSGWVD